MDRKMKIQGMLICLTIVIISLLAGYPVFAAEPFPGDSEQYFSQGLPAGYEPSGVEWHPVLQHFFVVHDNGYFCEMDINGIYVQGSNRNLNGRDLEAISIPDPSSEFIYLGCERYPYNSILKYNLSSAEITTYSVDQWLITTDRNQGLESLAFIPDDAKDPYDPVGGAFWAGNQGDPGTSAKVVVVRLPSQGTTVEYITDFAPVPCRIDIGGMYYDEASGILYIVYDGANVIRAVRPRWVGVNQLALDFLNEWNLPTNREFEGICILGQDLYMAIDNSPGVVMKYPNFLRHTVSVDSAEGYTGDNNMPVTISVSDVTGKDVTHAHIKLDYDASKLTFVSVSTEGTIAEGWSSEIISNEEGRIEFDLEGSTALTGEGVLVTLYFDLLADAGEGETPLDLKEADLVYVTDLPRILSTLVADGTFTILPPIINEAPVLAPIGNKQINEGCALVFNVDATDTNGDMLSFLPWPTLPDGAEFEVTINEPGHIQGVFHWQPTYSQAGDYAVIFTVTDEELTDSEQITITVSNVNRPPVLDPIGNKQVAEGWLLEFSIAANDPDPDDQLEYSVANLPSGASFNEETRVFSWRPGYDQAGTYENITFTVTDGFIIDSEAITITVTNTNRAPILAPVGPRKGMVGRPLVIKLSASDPDGDPLKYTISHIPQGATFDPTQGVFTWVPFKYQVGIHRISFGVTDGRLYDRETIIITIYNSNVSSNNDRNKK